MNEQKNNKIQIATNIANKEALAVLLNKQSQSDKAREINNALEDSPLTPLEGGVALRALSNILIEAIAQRKKTELEDSETYEKQFSVMGVKIEKASTTKYTFNPDPVRDKLLTELEEKTKELKEITKRLKARETYLKFLKTMITELDNDTGELIEVYPPKSKITDVLRFTFDKK